MKICFPVEIDNALESKVYGHFGSAPCFVIYDDATNTVDSITNSDQHHEHGSCSPFKALGGRSIDAVVVGGIGAGAINKLTSSGVAVYKASAPSVRENLALLASGSLQRFNPMMTCSGHSADGGCAHH